MKAKPIRLVVILTLTSASTGSGGQTICDPDTDVCRSCGDYGQPCCPRLSSYPECSGQTICDPDTDICRSCGDRGQPCCPRLSSYPECSGQTICDPDTDICRSCGDHGQPCCPRLSSYPECSGQTICDPYADICRSCGDRGQPCCPHFSPYPECGGQNICAPDTDICEPFVDNEGPRQLVDEQYQDDPENDNDEHQNVTKVVRSPSLQSQQVAPRSSSPANLPAPATETTHGTSEQEASHPQVATGVAPPEPTNKKWSPPPGFLEGLDRESAASVDDSTEPVSPAKTDQSPAPIFIDPQKVQVVGLDTAPTGGAVQAGEQYIDNIATSIGYKSPQKEGAFGVYTKTGDRITLDSREFQCDKDPLSTQAAPLEPVYHSRADANNALKGRPGAFAYYVGEHNAIFPTTLSSTTVPRLCEGIRRAKDAADAKAQLTISAKSVMREQATARTASVDPNVMPQTPTQHYRRDGGTDFLGAPPAFLGVGAEVNELSMVDADPSLMRRANRVVSDLESRFKCNAFAIDGRQSEPEVDATKPLAVLWYKDWLAWWFKATNRPTRRDTDLAIRVLAGDNPRQEIERERVATEAWCSDGPRLDHDLNATIDFFHGLLKDDTLPEGLRAVVARRMERLRPLARAADIATVGLRILEQGKGITVRTVDGGTATHVLGTTTGDEAMPGPHTHCNQFLVMFLAQCADNYDFAIHRRSSGEVDDLKRANGIADAIAGNAHWTRIDGDVNEAAEFARQGRVVVAAYRCPDLPDGGSCTGHVAVVVPNPILEYLLPRLSADRKNIGILPLAEFDYTAWLMQDGKKIGFLEFDDVFTRSTAPQFYYLNDRIGCVAPIAQ